MKDVVRVAKSGGIVLGICNGFQVLTEAGLLPGALLRNRSLKFVCRDVHLRVETSETLFTSASAEGSVLTIPIAHGDGNYFTDPDTLESLEANGQIVFRYCDREGRITEEANPNGALSNIAGIINAAGNVLGMMPHPERASDAVLGKTDGAKIFNSIVQSVAHRVPSIHVPV
jgi:phosphoribosylformylglycinamidine synthase